MLTLNMYVPSLTAMGIDLGVSYAEMSLSLSLYMVLTALLQIVMGPISDRYGRRPTIFWSLAVFLFASIGCALAQDYWTFMAFRMLQGAVVSAAALARAIVRDTSQPQEAAARLGTIGIAMALAPMFAPMAGGALEGLFGWRANFWVFTGMAAGLLWLTWVDVGETNTTPSSSIGKQMRKYPAVALNLQFWSYTLCVAFSIGVFFVYVTGVPLVATEHFGMSPAMVGAVLGLPPIGFLFGNWVTARIGRRIALSRMMIWGRMSTLLCLIAGLALWSIGVSHPAAFFVWMIAIGFGNGLTLPAGTAGAMSVRADLAGTAAGLSGAFAILMGGVAAAITGAILAWSPTPIVLYLVLIAFAVIGLVTAYPARSTERRLAIGK